MVVVDSLLWVERHSGTVTGLPPQEACPLILAVIILLPSRYSELPASQT